MALCGCPSGVVATALLALVVLPAQYYVPERREAAAERAEPALAALDAALRRLPPLDLLASAALLLLAGATYLAEWLHRKIMQRRIYKLAAAAAGSAERLRAWDARQEQAEAALRLAASAAREYSLLLYLLLRPRRAHPAPPAHPAPAPAAHRYHKLDDDLAFLSSAVDT